MAGVTPNIRLTLPTYDQPGWDTLMNANLQVLDSLVARGVDLTGGYSGLYVPGGAYVLNAVVTDPADSSLWQANSGFTTLLANTFAQERAANPAHWTNVTTSTTSSATNATLAAGSATNAATSASNASTYAAAALVSENNAAASATLAAAGASFNNTGRNLIHNGMFRVGQRGAGPFTISGAFTADRWFIAYTGGSITMTIAAASGAAKTAISDESAINLANIVGGGSVGASDYTAFSQKIEAVPRLAGKTVTVSFWAVATAGTPKLGVSIDQIFGTGGSPSASVTGAGQSVTLSTTWTRYSLTFAVASAIGKTFGTTAATDSSQLNFWLSAGVTLASRAGSVGVQSYTLQLWGVQLEIAASATPLEKIDYAVEIATCQRFYQIGTVFTAVYVAGAGQLGGYTPFVTQMRFVPTITYVGVSLTNSVSIASAQISATGFITTVSSSAPGVSGYNGAWSASAEA